MQDNNLICHLKTGKNKANFLLNSVLGWNTQQGTINYLPNMELNETDII